MNTTCPLIYNIIINCDNHQVPTYGANTIIQNRKANEMLYLHTVLRKKSDLDNAKQHVIEKLVHVLLMGLWVGL